MEEEGKVRAESVEAEEKRDGEENTAVDAMKALGEKVDALAAAFAELAVKERVGLDGDRVVGLVREELRAREEAHMALARWARAFAQDPGNKDVAHLVEQAVFLHGHGLDDDEVADFLRGVIAAKAPRSRRNVPAGEEPTGVVGPDDIEGDVSKVWGQLI